MFRNYLTIALRNLRKNKANSFINIAGLAVGLAVVIIISLWIWDELSFDHYHRNYDRIAQVMQRKTIDGQTNVNQAVPIPLARELRASYSNGFSRLVLASFVWDHVLSVNDTRVLMRGMFMEPEGPSMFTFKIAEGSLDGLKDPGSILISRSLARSLFGGSDPMNNNLLIDNKLTVKVAGVYEDLPANTTFNDIAFIAPWDLYYNNNEDVKAAREDWGNNGFQIFAEIAPNADMEKASASIKNAKLNRVSKEGAIYKPEIFLHSMRKWHLFSEFKNGVNTGGKIEFVWLFGIIGLFVLLLACINFMNLSTAKSEKRAREVGIRKAIGSLRIQLISQFFGESVLIALLSFSLSILLVSLLLPYFNEVAGKKMSILWESPVFWMAGIGFSIITGLIAGSYPAFYLSSFQAVKVLKGTFRVGRFAGLPRKILVVLQFTVSVALIIGTIVVYDQIQFAKDRSVGYDRSNLVAVGMRTNDLHLHYDALRSELMNEGLITGVAQSTSPTTAVYDNTGGFIWEGKDPNMTDQFAVVGVTYGYGKTVSWQFTKGRDFSPQLATDSSGIVLNEAAVKYMNLKDPIRKVVRWNDRAYTILGVVRDMVMESPYQPVKQTIFYIDASSGTVLNLRLNPTISVKDAIAGIESTCKKYSPMEPFSYKFMDDEYEKKFADEVRIGRLAGLFSILAVFISCLGLFGMATFMAEQRIREIGIRKTLGASVFSLWTLLSKDFISMMVISLLIAAPVAYIFMHQWLQQYSYRTGIPWWIFAVTSAGSFLITLFTVGFQAIKAALTSPVKSLRSE